MSLAPIEIERYARHIVLRDVGGPGQLKLKAARVLVIGAGGLGAPLIQYLAAAGVGTIGQAEFNAAAPAAVAALLSKFGRAVVNASTAGLTRVSVNFN